MAEIAPFTITTAGGSPQFDPAEEGDAARCGVGYFLVVRNSGTDPVVVAIPVAGNTSYGVPNPDPEWTVDAGGELWVPLLDAYRDPSFGLAWIQYSSTAGVTRAVVKR